MDSATISPFLQNCQANSLAVSRFGADWSLAKTMMGFVLNGLVMILAVSDACGLKSP